MSARSKARKQTLDLLYESDIRGSSAADLLVLRDNPDEGPDARPIRDFTKILIGGITENRRKIDELIWSDDVEDAVAIDEALNLARDLSTDESAGYIHGVLGRISTIKASIAR